MILITSEICTRYDSLIGTRKGYKAGKKAGKKRKNLQLEILLVNRREMTDQTTTGSFLVF
jgi:hypothetical protein